MYYQKEITLKARSRGFHIITDEIKRQIPELNKVKTGIMHIFIKHTSASLTINENISHEVKTDLENYFNRIVPDNAAYFEHKLEGTDDMSAHIKSSILGHSLTIPVTDGKFNLGTWQGIYLCEHRNYGGQRQIVITLIGDEYR